MESGFLVLKQHTWQAKNIQIFPERFTGRNDPTRCFRALNGGVNFLKDQTPGCGLQGHSTILKRWREDAATYLHTVSIMFTHFTGYASYSFKCNVPRVLHDYVPAAIIFFYVFLIFPTVYVSCLLSLHIAHTLSSRRWSLQPSTMFITEMWYFMMV